MITKAAPIHVTEQRPRSPAVPPALSLCGPSRRSGTALLAARRRGLRTPVGLPVVSAAEPLTGSPALDAAGRGRSPATMPGFHAGHPPRNKGLRYPADPPTVEEIVAVMRIAGDGWHGRRLRGLIVVLWRAGLRIDEALALREADLDRRRGSILPSRQGRACADASLLTSCATHTRSRWPAEASRSSSSNASSGTATSGSPPSISRASTTPKSSKPFTPAAAR